MSENLTFHNCRLCGGGYYWPPIFAGIFAPFDKPNPHLCSDCVQMKRERGEVTHDHALRCPKCGHVWAPDCDEPVWDDGESEVYCPDCDHLFRVETSITFTFRSPALLAEVG